MAAASPPIPAPMTRARGGATRTQCTELERYYRARRESHTQRMCQLLAGGRAGAVLRVCFALAVMHSLLASRQLKLLVAATLGERYRNGAYRFAYILQSTVCFTLLSVWFLRQPDRELYRVPAPWSWVMRLGQVASLGLGFSAVRVLGINEFNGLPQVQALVKCQEPRPEPEAQGPPLRADEALTIQGPYRFTRHPNNLAPLGVLALFPRMTVNRTALVLACAVYAVLGSLHEEYRLRAAYGDVYREYQRRVPFMIGPSFSRR
jgi:methanethiol S-methyltransferase